VVKNKYFLIALLILIADQATKFLIKNNLKESVVLIKNFLSISYTTNTGAVFGILKGANTSLIFISIFVLGLILFFWDRLKTNSEKILVALIVSGIIGNLIDRISYGFVVDFISFSFWPAFNIADSALVIGVLGLIYLEGKK
jgi:signal peptidase II